MIFTGATLHAPAAVLVTHWDAGHQDPHRAAADVAEAERLLRDYAQAHGERVVRLWADDPAPSWPTAAQIGDGGMPKRWT